MLPAANREAKPIVLASPGGGKVGEPGEEHLPFIRLEPADEVAALAEHVEKVEDSQNHLKGEGGKECGELLHTGIKVSGEGVLYQEGGEMKGP